jgi:hypothetical protein
MSHEQTEIDTPTLTSRQHAYLFVIESKIGSDLLSESYPYFVAGVFGTK